MSCKTHKDDSELYGNAGLKMLLLRVMVQRSREKNRNSKTLMGQKTFYRKIPLEKVLEITTRSRQAVTTVVPHGIPYVLEDSWNVANDDFQQNLCSRDLPFNIMSRRLQVPAAKST